MTPDEVVKLVGAPDFITHGGWEYDLDGEAPATLSLRWGAGGCENVQKRTPPKWRDGDTRDRDLVH